MKRRNFFLSMLKLNPNNSATNDGHHRTYNAMAAADSQPKAGEKTQTQAVSPEEAYADLLESQTLMTDSKVGYFGIYRYASPKDMAILGLSALSAISAGGLIPTFPVRVTFTWRILLTLEAALRRHGRPVSLRCPWRDTSR